MDDMQMQASIRLLAILRVWAKWAGNEIFKGVVTWFVILVLLVLTPIGRDDTDIPGWGFGRSGLKVYTDQKTGLQYLGTSDGGLTPRLDVKGRQMEADHD